MEGRGFVGRGFMGRGSCGSRGRTIIFLRIHFKFTIYVLFRNLILFCRAYMVGTFYFV